MKVSINRKEKTINFRWEAEQGNQLLDTMTFEEWEKFKQQVDRKIASAHRF